MESLEGDVKFRLEHVLTTNSLPVTSKHMASNEKIRRWPHFHDICLPETGDTKVTILTGIDRPDIIDRVAGQERRRMLSTLRCQDASWMDCVWSDW